jgi:hypothetical protein
VKPAFQPKRAHEVVKPQPLAASEAFMWKDLARSAGLTPADIDVEPLPVIGFETVPRYRIKYPDGYYRDRFDRAGDKYKGPPARVGVWFRSEIHRRRWRKAKRKLIVEGEKKAAAAVKHLDLDACGIGGCWGFSHKHEPLPEIFDHIAPGDCVDLVLDGDVEDPAKDIGHAALRFVEYCDERDATVRIVRLGYGPDGERLGLDDWLAALVDGKATRNDLRAAYEALEAIDPKDLVHPVVRDLNQQHAVVLFGSKAVIMREEHDNMLDREVIRFLRAQDLELFYANRSPVSVSEEKTVSQVKFWIHHRDRRTYAAIGMWPDGEAPSDAYNLWRGFSVEPKPGDCALYLDHWREVICAGNEDHYRWAVAWMAHAVQHRAEKPGTAIVMRGGEGVGKGTAAQGFGRLFGQHFVHVTSTRMVTGNFNAHLKDALVLFADEAVFAGDPAQRGALYGLITEDTLMIEPKFVDAIPIRNYTRILMASNNDWVVPAGRDARRFFVLDVADTRRQDHRYFKAINRQLEHGGYAALLDYLLHYDYAGVNLREPPLTEALLENKIHSLSPVEKFWFDVLLRGTLAAPEAGWTGWIAKTSLHTQFIEHAQRAGNARHRGSETELGMALHKLVPTLLNERRTIANVRRTGWKFPALADCRAAFEKHLKQPIAWPDGANG